MSNLNARERYSRSDLIRTGVSFTSLLPEQAMRCAGLDLAISVARRDRRWLRLARRSLDQRGRTAALLRADWRGPRHHLDTGALFRRVERLLEQAQD